LEQGDEEAHASDANRPYAPARLRREHPIAGP
jgi:hypothetical protein